MSRWMLSSIVSSGASGCNPMSILFVMMPKHAMKPMTKLTSSGVGDPILRWVRTATSNALSIRFALSYLSGMIALLAGQVSHRTRHGSCKGVLVPLRDAMLLQRWEAVIHGFDDLAPPRWSAFTVPHHVGGVAQLKQDTALHMLDLVALRDPDRDGARIVRDVLAGNCACGHIDLVASHARVRQERAGPYRVLRARKVAGRLAVDAIDRAHGSDGERKIL